MNVLSKKFLKSNKTIVYATPRCGSTYFCNELRKLKKYGIPNEYFNAQIGDGEDDLSLEYFINYISDKYTENDDLTTNFGIKVMYLHLEKAYTIFGDEGSFVETFKDANHIFLTRDSKLFQAISMYFNRNSDTPHLVNKKHKDYQFASDLIPQGFNHYVPFSYKAITEILEQINSFEKEWQLYFERHGIDPIVFEYSEFTEDPSIVRKRLEHQEEVVADSDDLKFKKIGGEINECFFDLYSLYREKDLDHNISKLEEKYHSIVGVFYYQVGCLYLNEGNYSLAREFLWKSRNSDKHHNSEEMKRRINNQLIRLNKLEGDQG